MSSAVFGVVVLVSLGLEPGSGARAGEASGLNHIQGTWTAKTGPRRGIEVELCIEGESARVEIQMPTGLRIKAEGRVEVDASTSPKSLDWVSFHSANGDELPVIRGIYRIEGDSLVVCNGGLNDARPSEFKAGDGLFAQIVTFSRKPTVVAQADDADARDLAGGSAAR